MKKSSFLVMAFILLWSLFLVGCTTQVNGSQLEEEQQQEDTQQNEDNQQEEDSSSMDNASEEEEVTSLVEEFGQTLQKVSILAPEDQVKESIEENYGDFLSSSLLSEWLNDPQSALGREVSSPWPDRIEILDMGKSSNHTYEVKGEIIEITSVEKVNGGIAAKRPITLILHKVEDRWLINDVSVGDYKAGGSILYKNTEYGFTFSLPESWEGYEIVTDTWDGTATEGQEINETVESGPILSIRHPEWTSENPRQDIPIMIFTLSQWGYLQEGEFHIGAAPIGPRGLGQNNEYVFTLPARYNFAFPKGYEEVEDILESDALQPMEIE